MTEERDPFEAEVVDWLADLGRTTASDVRYAGDGVATLPPRVRDRRRSFVTAAATIAVLVGVGSALLGRFSMPGTSLQAALPDPATFSGDPRLALCSGANALTIFEIDHLRDFYSVFPRATHLDGFPSDSEAPGLVVVYAGPPSGGREVRPALQSLTPAITFGPDEHSVCVVAGHGPADWAPIGIVGVDTTGLDPTAVLPDSSGPSDGPSPNASATAVNPGRPTDPTEPSQSPKPTIPVAPTPEWAIDLKGQLDCEGPALGLGGEIPDVGSMEAYGPTATEALATFLGPSNPYASLPTTGYEPRHLEPHWAEFAYAVDGKTKTVIVLSDTTLYGPGWTVMALRSCDASEFDPSTPLTFPVTVWTDANGRRMPTDVIRSHPGPAHCGDEDAIWLYVNDQLFFRDPKGVMAEQEKTPFDADAIKPSRAQDTDFRNGNQELWIDPKGDAYLVGPDRTERWPRSTDPQLGCA